MAIKQMETAGGDTAAMQAILKEMRKKFAKVETAMADLKSVSIKLPGAFREFHPGNVHNLDTPKEYMISVCVENFKTMYTLSKDMAETKQRLDDFEKLLKAYKK